MKKSKKNKPQWGGAREGSGRPRSYDGERTVTISFAVPPELVEKLDEYAKQEGMSRSKAITQVLSKNILRKSQK